MSKSDKLGEAKFFLMAMEHADERDPFRYCLSAFLSSARSVLQYAHKDVTGNASARSWYDGIVGSSLVLSYFKENRDFNIHTAPVPVQTQVDVGFSDHVALSESMTVTVMKGDVVIDHFETIEPPSPPPPPPSPPEMTTRYFFTDWRPQDVPELCGIYVAELEAFVAEGLARGFIQP